MNALMRIQVRVLAQEATNTLKQLAAAIKAVNSSGGGRGGGATSGLNAALRGTSSEVATLQRELAALGSKTMLTQAGREADAFKAKIAAINANLRGMSAGVAVPGAGVSVDVKSGRAAATREAAAAARVEKQIADQLSRDEIAAMKQTEKASKDLRVAQERAAKDAAAVTSAVARQSSGGGGISTAGAAAGGGEIVKQMGLLDRLSLKLDGNTTKTHKSITAMGKDLQWIGRQINFNFTLPISAAVSTATKWELANEAAFTRLKKVYGDSGKDYTAELNTIKGALRSLSDIYGVAQSDVQELGASWAAAGAQGGDLLLSVETSLKLAALGDYKNISDTFNDLITIQGAYKLSTAQLQTAIALLNTTENMTAATLPDLVTGIARTGVSAQVVGIDIRHLAAMMAVLTPATGSAANAGNALKTIFSRLMAPTKQAIDALKELGINFYDSSYQALNGSQRLELMAQKFTGLTSSQQAYITSVMASRFQIEKFDTLMADLANKTGTYNKVLEALDPSKDTANWAQANKEIQTLLSSDPKKLQIIMTQLQNFAADAVLPLIPALLGALNGLRALTQWFGNLSPQTQKLVFMLLGLVVAVGVLAQGLGSAELLVATFGRGLLGLVKLGGFVGSFFGLLETKPTEVASVMGKASAEITGAIEETSAATIAALQEQAAASQAVLAEMVAANAPIIETAMTESVAVVSAGETAMVAEATIGMEEMLLATEGVIGIVAILEEVMAESVAVIALGEQAMAAEIVAGGVEMGAAVDVAETTMAAAAAGFPIILVGAITAAVVAAVVLIVKFRKQIADGIGAAVDWMKRAFNSLPASVQSALIGVLHVVEAIIKQIIKWLSYLNPFARHSPSLVDNVTAGVAAIRGQYASLSGIGSVFGEAAANLDKFAAATANVIAASKNSDRADQRKAVATNAPSAVPVLNQLFNNEDQLQAVMDQVQAQIDAQTAKMQPMKAAYDDAAAAVDAYTAAMQPLKDHVDQLNTQLSDAKSKLQDFATAPIAGMKETNDAIWANDQAQKALQLQMMKMEDASGSYDDVAAKISALNGDMENVRGKAEDLRLAGAGSDILGAYNDQLDALQKQKDGLQVGADNAKSLADQLAALQRQAQEMDLEKALRFEPLQKQIADLADTTKELSFDEIIAGIKTQRDAVDSLTTQYDTNKAALDQQQAVLDGLIATRDQLKTSYDAEDAFLTSLQDRYNAYNDQLQKIKDAIDAVVQAQSNLDQKKAGGGGGGGGGGSKFGDLTGDVGDQPALPDFTGGLDMDALAKQWADQAKNMFKFDPFSNLRDWWNKLTGWWDTTVGPWFGGLWGDIVGFFSGWDFNSLGMGMDTGWFSNWWASLKGLAETWGHDVFTVVDNIFRSIGSVLEHIPFIDKLRGIAKDVAGWFTDIYHDAVDAGKKLLDHLKGWGDLFAPFMEALTHIFNFARTIFNGIIDVVEVALRVTLAIAAPVLGLIAAAFDFAWNFIKNITQPIFNFLASFIGGILDSIHAAIKLVLDLINGDWGAAWQDVKDFFYGIWEQIKAVAQLGIDAVIAILRALATTASDIWDVIKGAAEAAWNWIKDTADTVWGTIKDAVTAPIDAAKELISGIWDAMKSLASTAWSALKDSADLWFGIIKDAIMTPINAAKSAISTVWDAIKTAASTAWGGIKTAADTAWTTVKDAIMTPINAAKDAISTVWTDIVSGITGMPDRIRSAAGSMWDGIKDAFKSVLNTIIGWWNGLDFSITLPELTIKTPPGMDDWHIGGQTWTFGLPDIPKFHQGGWVDPRKGAEQISMLKAGEFVFTPAQVRALNRMGLKASDGMPVNNAMTVTNKTVNFYGDLSFPNITDGTDAEQFLTNLEALSGV